MFPFYGPGKHFDVRETLKNIINGLLNKSDVGWWMDDREKIGGSPDSLAFIMRGTVLIARLTEIYTYFTFVLHSFRLGDRFLRDFCLVLSTSMTLKWKKRF
jgi:hypothetical protein